MARARAGEGEAFRALTAPYHRELQVHCYRMLGSVQDSEDALQNTLLAAWRGLSDFEGRSSIRTWLYRIATNCCLSMLRSANRRAAKESNMVDNEWPEPSRLGDIPWLEPLPDSVLDGALVAPPGPEATYEQTESITLAFVTALQILPARQRAVLILREVLGYRAAEVAAMLDCTVESVNSALKRARAGLGETDVGAPPPPIESPVERDLVARFVRAYQAGDVDAVVELLTADVRLTMPPEPFEYHGREKVSRFLAAVFRAGPRYRLIRTRANCAPAFGLYLRTPHSAIEHGVGLLVLGLATDHIGALTRFDSGVLPRFGLPASLTDVRMSTELAGDARRSD